MGAARERRRRIARGLEPVFKVASEKSSLYNGCFVVPYPDDTVFAGTSPRWEDGSRTHLVTQGKASAICRIDYVPGGRFYSSGRIAKVGEAIRFRIDSLRPMNDPARAYLASLALKAMGEGAR